MLRPGPIPVPLKLLPRESLPFVPWLSYSAASGSNLLLPGPVPRQPILPRHKLDPVSPTRLSSTAAYGSILAGAGRWASPSRMFPEGFSGQPSPSLLTLSPLEWKCLKDCHIRGAAPVPNA